MSSPKKDPSLVSLGKAIRSIRKEKEISQEDLALEAGINRSHMGALERGENNASVQTLLKVRDILKVPLSEIFKRAQL